MRYSVFNLVNFSQIKENKNLNKWCYENTKTYVFMLIYPFNLESIN